MSSCQQFFRICSYPSSKRLLNEYWVWFSTVLCVVILPFPSLMVPFHTAVAWRLINFCLFVSDVYRLKVVLFGKLSILKLVFNPGKNIQQLCCYLQAPLCIYLCLFQSIIWYFGIFIGNRYSDFCACCKRTSFIRLRAGHYCCIQIFRIKRMIIFFEKLITGRILALYFIAYTGLLPSDILKY